MSAFKNNLNEEIEKRRGEETANKTQPNDIQSDEVLPPSAKIKKQKMFSFLSFLGGLFICFMFASTLVTWAWSKSERTKLTLEERLPSKTAIVDVVKIKTDTAEAKTVLSIPEVPRQEVGAMPLTPATQEIKQAENPQPPSLEAPEATTANTPYHQFKTSFIRKTNKPLISFVITDLGLSESKTQNIIQNFSKEISFAFSPYTQNLNSLIDTARKDGHEAWLSLPLETKQFPLNDPGPSTLLVNASTEKNQTRLNDVLNSAKNYAGFISPYNHIFKAEDANVNPIIKEIFNKGYAIIDSNISSRSFIEGLAEKNEYPHGQVDIWLDSDLSPLSLNQNLRKITEYGENKKNIIVMLRPYPNSLKAIQKFMNSKAIEQFELAPVSAQLKNN